MYQRQSQQTDSARRRILTGCHAGTHPPRRRSPRRAISLLETTIAVAILGVGLIMVAGVFPVALYQHRETAAQSDANRLMSKAESLLRARVQNEALWYDDTAYADEDSPWYLLPSTNLQVGAIEWDLMPALAPPAYSLASSYANIINGVTEADISAAKDTPTFMFGVDTLSDRTAPFTAGDALTPFTDTEFVDAAHRYAWYGFYRRTAAGTYNFAVAVCRQQREQAFAEQFLGENTDTTLAPEALNPYSMPLPAAVARRLPVPWRVSVSYYGGHVIGNQPVAPMLGSGYRLDVLAPRGSRLMIQGDVHEEPPAGAEPAVMIPSGRILTVVDSPCPGCVEIREDISELPVMDLYGDGSKLITFDVWVIPPAVNGSNFGTNSPVIEWKQVL